MNILVKDGNLFAVPAGQQPLSLIAVDKTRFRPAAFDDVTITFNIEAGKTMGFEFTQGPNTMLLKHVEDICGPGTPG